MDIVGLIFNNLGIVVALVLFVIGWYFGTRNERKHLVSLDETEKLLGHIIITSERFYEPCTQGHAKLVIGSVVIAQDRFKSVIAGLLSFFGKNLTGYETMLERGRREAVLRMKWQASEIGYNHILGMRIETTNIGAHDPNGDAIEVIAYGTAVQTVGDPNIPPRLG